MLKLGFRLIAVIRKQCQNYRPDSSRQRSGEGAGLGLAIAKSIIEAHGGAITAQSNDQVTVFEISSPGCA